MTTIKTLRADNIHTIPMEWRKESGYKVEGKPTRMNRGAEENCILGIIKDISECIHGVFVYIPGN
jgi:hypothetical protein